MADSGLKAYDERCRFTMNHDISRYDEGIRYVFCDELEGYTFNPYTGIKKLRRNCTGNVVLEEANIFLIRDLSEKITKVPCIIVDEYKKVYITEHNFNKYWKLISEDLCLETRKARDSNEVTHESMNSLVDLSLVENSLRIAEIGNAFTIEYKGKEKDIETQRLISKKASALEDNRIRFVYAKSDNLVHEKTCVLVKKIKYSDFDATAEIPSNRKLCPQCKAKIFIRNAIKSDTKRFSWYLRFFEEGRVSNRVLERFLYNSNVKLHMESIDELIVECNEDTWRIKTDTQDTYILYHNNYVMVSEKERYITEGFHVQKHHPPYLPGILQYIQRYNWQKHHIII